MKTMKKAMILALVLCVNVLFTACSSDDAPQDTLVGKWQIIKGAGANGEESVLSECQKKSTLEYRTDNTFTQDTYEENMNDECISSTEEGTWKEKGANVLESILDGEVIVDETKYSFENGNLKLWGVDRDGKENGSYTLYKKI